MDLRDIVSSVVHGRAGEVEAQAIGTMLQDRCNALVEGGREYIKANLFEEQKSAQGE